MSETVERIYPEAINLRSVAKMERKKGNVELAHVIEGAADLYERTASDVDSATKALNARSAVVIDQHEEITSLRAQLDEARRQIEIKTESDAYRDSSRFDVVTYSFQMVGYYREESGSITNQQADNLAHMMAHSFNEVRLKWANALGFENPGDLERGVRSVKSQLDEARRKAIEDIVGVLETLRLPGPEQSVLDAIGQYGLGAVHGRNATIDVALEIIRALLSESKT